VRGPGLHTGLTNEVSLEKSSNIDWLEFSTQIEGVEYSAPAVWSRLSGTTRSTALVLRGSSKRRFELGTVEHFLASAYIYDIQNYKVKIDVDASQDHVLEMPILDGSSKEWTYLSVFQSEELPAERKVWLAVKDFDFVDEGRRVTILPSEDMKSSHYVCQVDFGGPWQQKSNFSIDWMNPLLGRETFEKDIASARTFGFKHELETLVEKGLIRGASLENALLLDGAKVWNEGGFRVANELAAHKLLDSIGDFALLGRPILGTISTEKAGHQMHLRTLSQAVKAGALVQAVLKNNGKVVLEG